jgi:hypothetical protein
MRGNLIADRKNAMRTCPAMIADWSTRNLIGVINGSSSRSGAPRLLPSHEVLDTGQYCPCSTLLARCRLFKMSSVKIDSSPSNEREELITDEEHSPHAPTDPEIVSVHSPTISTQPPKTLSAKIAAIIQPISRFHQRIPVLKRLPAFVIFPIAALVIVNCAVWVIVGIILRYHLYSYVFFALMTGRWLAQ